MRLEAWLFVVGQHVENGVPGACPKKPAIASITNREINPPRQDDMDGSAGCHVSLLSFLGQG